MFSSRPSKENDVYDCLFSTALSTLWSSIICSSGNFCFSLYSLVLLYILAFFHPFSLVLFFLLSILYFTYCLHSAPAIPCPQLIHILMVYITFNMFCSITVYIGFYFNFSDVFNFSSVTRLFQKLHFVGR